MIQKELCGVGGVPICKHCKYHTISDTCRRIRNLVTGEPVSCEVCRMSSDAPACGVKAKFYEEKVRNKGIFSISFFGFTILNAAIVFAVFSSPFVLAAALACFLLVELVVLWIFVVCAIEADDTECK